MTKARELAAFAATIVLLLVGAAFVWQFGQMLIQPLSANAMVILFGTIATQLWTFDVVVALLGAACLAGAVAIMVRRPRRAI